MKTLRRRSLMMNRPASALFVHRAMYLLPGAIRFTLECRHRPHSSSSAAVYQAFIMLIRGSLLRVIYARNFTKVCRHPDRDRLPRYFNQSCFAAHVRNLLMIVLFRSVDPLFVINFTNVAEKIHTDINGNHMLILWLRLGEFRLVRLI